MYYKCAYHNHIVAVGEIGVGEEITANEYIDLLDIINNRPPAEEGYAYMLRADTLEWELVELPPVPQEDPTDEDIINTLFGGDEQ